MKNRQGYTYLLEMFKWNRVKAGCTGHPQLSSGGVQAAELQLNSSRDSMGRAACGSEVTQRSSVRSPPPPPHPQLITDITPAARDFSGKQGPAFPEMDHLSWKTYSSYIVYLLEIILTYLIEFPKTLYYFQRRLCVDRGVLQVRGAHNLSMQS